MRLIDISKVVEEGLCHGCGSCAGVCPSGAIEMRVVEGLWTPEISSDKCTSCGICAKVCPGYQVSFEDLNLKIYGKIPSDCFVGEWLNCYVGYSTDEKLRYDCASGGLASQILIYALEHHIIDGALVTRMSKSNPLYSESFIARNPSEIVEASKSKYCPVAANSALKDILKEEGRFAVVGLPCHLHGIRKAEQIYPQLQKKIILHLGLMCSHMVNYRGTDFVAEKLDVDKNKVESITYRGSGWPGSMTIKSNGQSKNIPLVGKWRSYWPVFSSFLYTPFRCIMCPDQMAELADISLGDAWLPEFRGDRVGRSILVTKTQFAEDLLKRMCADDRVSLSPTTIRKVKKSQAVNLKFKKNDFFSRLQMLKFARRHVPEFYPKPTGPFSLLAFVRALFIFTSIKISSSKRAMSILVHFPFPIFRLYSGIYKLLSFA
jgi:coenzyme F420 hydrogenase subunit beta